MGIVNFWLGSVKDKRSKQLTVSDLVVFYQKRDAYSRFLSKLGIL